MKDRLADIEIVRNEWLRVYILGEVQALSYLEHKDLIQVTCHRLSSKTERLNRISYLVRTGKWPYASDSLWRESDVSYIYSSDKLKVVVQGYGAIYQKNKTPVYEHFIEEWVYEASWKILRLYTF
ncbi:hypothetical protein BGP77_06585 [Saccharospirillum sp. MSK14-1]|nr:hypothetical protein BGP77_06585 [Saccharospirillum sp. MSK14-1]